MRDYTVYMHVCPNGKRYIGVTCRKPDKRWNNGKGYIDQQLFYRAIKKYGWENIEHIILYESLTQEEAFSKEVELIAKYKSNNTRYGYNVDNGGNSAGKLSEKTKEKIRQAHLGKKLSEEHRQKISNSNKGKRLSKEVKEKIRLANLGNPSPMKGKRHTEETKRKMSLSQIGKHLTEETKKKLSESHKGKKYNINLTQEQLKIKIERCKQNSKNQEKKICQCDMNENIIKIWDSSRQIERELGYNHSNIIQCCKKRYGYISLKGYKWRYCDEH